MTWVRSEHGEPLTFELAGRTYTLNPKQTLELTEDLAKLIQWRLAPQVRIIPDEWVK